MDRNPPDEMVEIEIFDRAFRVRYSERLHSESRAILCGNEGLARLCPVERRESSRPGTEAMRTRTEHGHSIKEPTTGSPKFMIPLATPEGLEPPTLGSEDQCSIQLSYGAALITS